MKSVLLATSYFSYGKDPIHSKSRSGGGLNPAISFQAHWTNGNMCFLSSCSLWDLRRSSTLMDCAQQHVSNHLWGRISELPPPPAAHWAPWNFVLGGGGGYQQTPGSTIGAKVGESDSSFTNRNAFPLEELCGCTYMCLGIPLLSRKRLTGCFAAYAPLSHSILI